MYKEKRAIALIPARGGSRGLPGKNIRMLCGHPLVVWSIRQARDSALVDCVCVTTDSQEIAEICRTAGAEVPFLRPAEYATDTAPTLAAVEHALDYYANFNQCTFDYVILLEPTSPLRHPGDIDNMLVRLIDNSDRFDSIISIGEVAEHPSTIERKVGERLEPYCPDLPQTARRQDNPKAYFPFGVGYAVKTETLRRERNFFSMRRTYYELRRYQNYEIDDLYDFLCVEAVMKHEWKLL